MARCGCDYFFNLLKSSTVPRLWKYDKCKTEVKKSLRTRKTRLEVKE